MIKLLKQYSIFEHQHIESFELLKNQGYCNTNYLLKTDTHEYLVRKFKLENDRKLEFRVQNLAYENNIAAEPFLLDEEKGLMVCTFLEGKHKEILSKADLVNLAQLLKKLHSIPFTETPMQIEQMFTSPSKETEEAFAILEMYAKEYVLCHNDLNPHNILFTTDIKLIDWEFSGLNDRYFDLASVCIEFDLSIKDESCFLSAYFERESGIDHDKINAYKVIYKALCLQWFEAFTQ
jgi:thiamine kinase-like enzyme